MLNHPDDREGKPSAPFVELAVYVSIILVVIALPVLVLGL